MNKRSHLSADQSDSSLLCQHLFQMLPHTTTCSGSHSPRSCCHSLQLRMLSRTLFIIALHARVVIAQSGYDQSGYGSGSGWIGCGVNFDTYCELYNWPQCGISDIKRREIASDRLRRTKCGCIDEHLCYTLHGEAMSRVCQERGETAGVCSTVRVNFSSNQLPWIN